MLICPNCRSEVFNSTCSNSDCAWKICYKENIPVLLSSYDINNGFFKDYMSNYDNIADEDLEKSIQDVDYIKAQAEKLSDYIGNVDGLSVCEVGVGQGHLFRALAEKSPKKITGVDISLSYLTNLSKDGHDVFLANAENLPFSEDFDVIVATDIMEHVVNSADFLVSINRALKENGLFAVRVPYEENLLQYSKLLGCKYNFVHLRVFTEKILVMQLAGSGFTIRKIYYDGFTVSRMRWIWRIVLFRQIASLILKLNSKSENVASVNNFIGKLIMKPVEIVAVAEKTSKV